MLSCNTNPFRHQVNFYTQHNMCPAAPDPAGTDSGLQGLFALFPWSMLSKGYQDFATAAAGLNPGISWDNRFGYCQAEAPAAGSPALSLPYYATGCVMSLGQGLWVLALQARATLCRHASDVTCAFTSSGTLRMFPCRPGV